jgi:hypothetical protein
MWILDAQLLTATSNTSALLRLTLESSFHILHKVLATVIASVIQDRPHLNLARWLEAKDERSKKRAGPLNPPEADLCTACNYEIDRPANHHRCIRIIAGRKPGMRAAHSQSTSVGQPQAQSNIFGNIDPNIINGTSNQQNGFGNPFAHLNSGIPPSTAQQSIVPPSSGFNFSVNGTSSIKNPFEAGFGQSSSNGVGGFQGSLFSIPAATKPEPPEQKNTISVRINPPENDTALWASHAPFLMNSNNNEQNQTQPSSTASSFGSTFTSAQQAAPPANPFASFGTQPTTSSSFSFGQTSTQTPQQQPASNLFASPFKSTSNLFGQTPSQAQPAQPVTTPFNLFGQTSSQAQQPQAASNIFGVPPVQTQNESSATKVCLPRFNPLQMLSTPTFIVSNALRQVGAQAVRHVTES